MARKARLNTYLLPDILRSIVEGVYSCPRPIGRIELARKYGASIVERLIGNGYLAEYIDGSIAVTPLTEQEIGNFFYRPWSKPDLRRLDGLLRKKTGVMEIAGLLQRPPADIVSAAWRAGYPQEYSGDGFQILVRGWKRPQIRDAIIEVERRGLDASDDGADLTHRALKLRFAMARKLINTRFHPETWPRGHAKILREAVRARLSILQIARRLSRSPVDIAHRMRIEGRNMTRWIADEDLIVVDGTRDGLSAREIAAKLSGRTTAAVRYRRKVLGLIDERPSLRLWAPEENALLRQGVAGALTYSQIAKTLPGRTTAAVKTQARKLGLRHPSRFRFRESPRQRSTPVQKPWVSGDNLLLLEAWAHGVRGSGLEASVPGRSEHACIQHIKVLLRIYQRGRPWNMTSDQVLIRAVDALLDPRMIARLLGRTVKEIEARTIELGLRKETNGKCPTFNSSAIATISDSTSFHGRKRHSRDIIRQAIALKEAGWHNDQICAELRISTATLYRRIDEFRDTP